MSSLEQALENEVANGRLLGSAADNIRLVLNQPDCQGWEYASIEELIRNHQWTELNDRFYQTLKFGTGGLRGRTIGKVVTMAERGEPLPSGRPQYPAVGTNAMNYFNVSRATQGLVNYLKKNFAGIRIKIVLSHDTRHFSREFAELAARVATEMGADAYLFNAERSTPELSFAVRHLHAHAGAVITASHNPPHDNGYKAYFSDGAQVVEPHASGIINEVLKVTSGEVSNKAAEPGGVIAVGDEIDAAYLDALSGLVLDPDLIRSQRENLRIVYTALHGTGAVIVPRILERFGFDISTVSEQSKPDGRFPTVKSPNPENAEAFTLAIQSARQQNASVIFATDPDADRMGVAVRAADGEYRLLTGNQIGSLMAEYRLNHMVEKGILTPDNISNAALIKTFVTTDLQKSIAAAYGAKCIDTLTGFKYIGEKLLDYEQQAGGRDGLDDRQWRDRLLERSTYMVFGGEESYGYLASDYVRDKDANASVLMFSEVVAHASSRGISVLDYLDEIYLKYGFYQERLGTLTFEGEEGASKIRRLLESYRTNPPRTWGGKGVQRIQNFAEEDIFDADGKLIPKEMMLMFHLGDGARVVVRGSGTEPKIKYYFFGKAPAPSKGALAEVKQSLSGALDELWAWTQRDVNARVG
jgi:phosphoglucomutase